MADVHSAAIRSYNMSQIRGKHTKPELLVRQFLHASGLRYRLNSRALPGKPDLVFPKYKTVVFVHGCFWHGHEGCRYFVLPKTRVDFWTGKIGRNIANDLRKQNSLLSSGWRVLTVWECELKPQYRKETLSNLLLQITGPPDADDVPPDQ